MFSAMRFLQDFQELCVILPSETLKHKTMTTMALNNLWSYLQGLALSRKDRNWLASKLMEATEKEVAETRHQQEYVKETLYRALDEVEAAKREGRQLQTLDDFIKELQMEEAV